MSYRKSSEKFGFGTVASQSYLGQREAIRLQNGEWYKMDWKVEPMKLMNKMWIYKVPSERLIRIKESRIKYL